MKNIEKMLEDEKKRINSLTAPDELEERMRTVLVKKKKNNRTIAFRSVAIAIILILSFSIYHYNALAYYGKKLLGFDEIIGDTLQALNEQGMGQMIDQSVQLADGSLLTISGIMADSNRTILYYKLTNPNGLPNDPFMYFNPTKITGFLTSAYKEGSQGLFNEDETELIMVADFEPVSPFSKRLTLHYSTVDQEEQTLSFSYDPNEAMGKEVNIPIRETINVDRGTIAFSNIKATPTMTVVTGKVNIQLDEFDQMQIPYDGIELKVNGERLEKLGNSSHSSGTGTEFSLHFDALPDSIDSLELVVKKFIGYQSVRDTFSLNENRTVLNIGEKNVQIEDISVTSDRVLISVQTEKGLIFDNVAIIVNGKSIPVETVYASEEKWTDGTIETVQTMVFPATNRPEALFVEGMYCEKKYDKPIVVPVK